MQQEPMLEYVLRKLNDKAYNCAEAARRTGIKRSTISELASGKSPSPAYATVEKLYQHFKSLEN
jgi:transcriptional regulator with XRE-family HTH domain